MKEFREYFGFTVYRAEDGYPAEACDVFDFPVLEGSFFALSDDGELMAVGYDTWRDLNSVKVPKEGKYLIQFADATFMKW